MHVRFETNFVGGEFLSAILQPNVWTHLALTFSNGFAKVYINGVPQGAPVGGFPLSSAPTSNHTLSIGSGALGAFFGQIDDVSLYSGVLSAAQIASHYNRTAGPASTAAPTITGTAQETQTLDDLPGLLERRAEQLRVPVAAL